MLHSRFATCAALACGLLAATVVSPLAAEPIKVGAKAPAFELKDQNGKSHSLDQLLKSSSGPVALVFYRSADW